MFLLDTQCSLLLSSSRHKSDPDKSLVINVEYNQLDPLLRTQGDCKGDVADPETGYSPFPGNANNIVIEMDAYAKTLHGEDQGVVVEFVNPKYKDDTRTEFKKPTRLECMMQDIPKLFQKEMGKEANIGFTMFDRWFTFSPAKVCSRRQLNFAHYCDLSYASHHSSCQNNATNTLELA